MSNAQQKRLPLLVQAAPLFVLAQEPAVYISSSTACTESVCSCRGCACSTAVNVKQEDWQPAGPMPTAPGPIATAGVPVVATHLLPQVAMASGEVVAPPVVNGAFAMPPAKAIQKRRASLPKEAPQSDVSPATASPRSPVRPAQQNAQIQRPP